MGDRLDIGIIGDGIYYDATQEILLIYICEPKTN